MEENTKSFKVLAVDDNPKNIQVIGSILMDANYEVGFAMDGQQALDLLIESKDYDLVLLDVSMPVMNGFECCRAIRKNDKLKEIPIIFLTAMNEPDHIISGFDAGGQDYVTKPFNSRELLSRVKTHLELKRSKDQLKIVNQWLEIKVKERTFALEQAYSELEIANNELIYLDKAKGDFIEKLSHEIRAPLAGIMGFISVLKDNIDPAELFELLKYLDISAARIERFATISMLVTELRTKTSTLNSEIIKISELIEFAKQRQADQIELKKASIIIDPDNLEHFTIKGERGLLEICFESLLDNALKFSPNNCQITINVEKINGHTHCTFVDQGRTFSKENLVKVYEPINENLEQKDDNEALDIYLVKLIMDAHHGKMEVSNNPDEGATIALFFPD